ncbi:MAG: type II/IV secretion system protein, partial [Oxalobacteraceae bacterium]|nr:type II/IV secretion system protein [Oxalobacteraceae bacterium]
MSAQPAPVVKASSKFIDLQQVFTWLLADGIVEKADVKARFTAAQGILRNATLTMHPLTAVAQSKLTSALP